MRKTEKSFCFLFSFSIHNHHFKKLYGSNTNNNNKQKKQTNKINSFIYNQFTFSPVSNCQLLLLFYLALDSTVVYNYRVERKKIDFYFNLNAKMNKKSIYYYFFLFWSEIFPFELNYY